MGILKALERRSHPSSPDPFMVGYFGGRPSATGVVVTADTALMSSPVWRAVSLLTKSIASIPLNTYAYLPGAGGGKSLNVAHALFDLLHNAPNDWQTSYEWREMMVGHLELRGNAYSKIITAPNGKITALIPLHPDRVWPHYRAVVPGGPKVRFYQYAPLEGPAEVLFWDEMLHWRGFSTDGISGISRIAMAAEAIGLALAAEEHGARFFSNDATPGGVLSHPKTLSEEAQKRLKKSWMDRQQGVTKAHAPAVLEEGLTWTSIGVTSKDAQFLETRKFQIDEVARWFDIPPHKLMEMSASTFGNIEEQNIEFVTDAVIPRCVKITQALMRDLMSQDDRKKNFINFVVKGLLRGDMKSRFEAWAIAKNAGFMSADDICAEEDLNPLPDGQGKMYLVPLNMIPADKVGAMADKAAEPTPPPAPPPAPAPAKDGTPAPVDPPAPTKKKSQRSAHIAELRARVAMAHRHVVADASLRSLKREVVAGRRALQSARSSQSTAPIAAFAADFYLEHELFVIRSFEAPVRTAVDAIDAIVALEVNAEPTGTDALDVLAHRLAQEIGKAHVARSRAELRTAVKTASAEDCAAAVEARFAEWESTRSTTEATSGLASITDTVAAALYAAAGLPAEELSDAA